MRRIHLIIIAALMALSFYLGYCFGNTSSAVVKDDRQVQALQQANKKLAAQRMWDETEISHLYASIKQDSLDLAELKVSARRLAYQVSLQKQEFKKEIDEIRGAALAKLDSFRWARYPDSVTVAKRYQQLQYENY